MILRESVRLEEKFTRKQEDLRISLPRAAERWDDVAEK